MDNILINHIECNPKICGGKPCIKGTRIRVWDIHIWHDLRGMSPAEIVAAFPQLTMADVYAALAYYLDNREQIETAMKKVEEDIKQSEQISTRYSQLRDQLVQEDEGNGDKISSG